MKKFRWFFLLCVSVVGFGIDWLSKWMVSQQLDYGHQVKILGEYVGLVFVYNKAALFGLDPRALLPQFPLNTFFLIFSVIAIAALLLYYRSIRDTDRFMHWGLALVLPGAIGNLFDRVVHPQMGVVDFIRLGLSPTVSWPIFNFADIYITIGVGLILISFIREERARTRQTVTQETKAA